MATADRLAFAWRAIRGHPLRSLLSLFGMSIGVGSVVLLTALGDGARTYVADQFAGLGTNLVMVVPGKTETTRAMPGVGGVPNDLTLADFQALLRHVRNVRRGAPIAMATGSVSRRERRRQVAVVGSTADFLGVRRLEMERGEFLPDTDLHRGASVVVLGATVATELFPGENPIGATVRIEEWRMRVVGVLSARGVQMGLDLDDIVVVPVATAMRVFNRTSLFRILLEASSSRSLDTVEAQTVRILAERHGEEDVTCLTQDAVLETFSSILLTLTLVLTAIASISLSVAGIGIMNVMLVSVSERREEIGLLKAVGVSERQIVSVFIAEATMLSAAGGVAGLTMGFLLVRVLVALYPEFPASPPLWAVSAAFTMTLVVGSIFGVLPARRASHLDPVRALARK